MYVCVPEDLRLRMDGRTGEEEKGDGQLHGGNHVFLSYACAACGLSWLSRENTESSYIYRKFWRGNSISSMEKCYRPLISQRTSCVKLVQARRSL